MVRGGGKAVMDGYLGVVIKNPVLVPPVLLCWWWMMMITMRCSKDLQLWHALLQWWRTYSGLMPPWWWMKWWGLTMVACLIHFLVGREGEGGSSPATSPSWVTVWDHFHFPLVAPVDPLRYTLPDNSFDSCLAHTSNIVQASLAVPPLKNLHLRQSQMAAARSQVGFHARDDGWGSRTFSSWDRCSSAVVFGGGSWARLR